MLLGSDALGRLALGQITGTSVATPPPGGRLAQIHELAAVAQPYPWVYAFAGGMQPFAPGRIPAALLAVTVSPQIPIAPGRLSALVQIVTAWQSDPWIYAGMGSQTAYKARQLSPGVPGQSADRPPVTLGGPYALKVEAVSIAQPDPWTYSFMGSLQPFGRRNLSAGVPGQGISPPPLTRPGQLAKLDQIASAWQPDPWLYASVGARQAYMGRQISPGAPGQSVNEPPYSRSRVIAMLSVIRSWDPPPYNFEARIYASGKFPTRLRPSARGYIIL
jgi:hypothetical protein